MRDYAKLLRATLTASLMLVAMAGAAIAGPIATMLLPVTASAGVLGQSPWCFVPPGSETLYCDYVAYGSCVDSNRDQVKAGGVCVPRPSR